ncbi:MAG: hypothetical protein JW795_11430, partial [Chitinivibrionales bacterium]|nr:hypothetical protein [Chitinivibrionales bacterium]
MNYAKHAVVINPWIVDFKLYDEWMHPLGLYLLMSLLEQNGWQVSYINCLARQPESKTKRYATGEFPNVEIEKPPLYQQIPRKYKHYGISSELLFNQLAAAAQPDIIFIGSSMTYWYYGLLSTLAAVRQVYPDTTIIIGGLTARLIGQKLAHLPNTVIFRKSLFEEKSIDTLSQLHPALQNLTAHQWLPTMTPRVILQKSAMHAAILTSLGCPYRCEYCINAKKATQFVHRDLALIIEEMDRLITAQKVADFAFYDDALLYNSQQNFRALMHQVQQRFGSTLRFHTPNGLHARWITRDIAEQMYISGFKTVRIGYESNTMTTVSQTNMVQKTNKAQLQKKIQLLKCAGFPASAIGVYVMGGLAGQKVESMMQECSFIASLEVLIKPVFLSPVPQTPLFDYYATRFPALLTEPLWHNDTFFITALEGWSFNATEEIRHLVRQYN